MRDTPKKSKAEAKEAERFQWDNVDHFARGIIEFLHGNDRTVAIVGAAFVEDMLEQTLRFVFVNGSQGAVNGLFEPDRPLSTFSAKIEMCLVLGIIGLRTYQNLRLIKEIRNKFAHKMLLPTEKQQMGGLSFRTPKIVEWCHTIKVPEGYDFDNEPRKKFAQTCLMIVVVLHEYLKKTERAKPTQPILG